MLDPLFHERLPEREKAKSPVEIGHVALGMEMDAFESPAPAVGNECLEKG